MTASPNPSDSATEIVITRVFAAPRDLVWRAWTEPAMVERWWAPRGFDTKVLRLDVRPGGESKYVMRGPDGTEYPGKGVFKEVQPPERVVTSDEFDEGFDLGDAGDLLKGIVLTCTFEELGPQTKRTMRIQHRTVEGREAHEEMGVIGGWNSSFDCLDDLLAELAAAG